MFEQEKLFAQRKLGVEIDIQNLYRKQLDEIEKLKADDDSDGDSLPETHLKNLHEQVKIEKNREEELTIEEAIL